MGATESLLSADEVELLQAETVFNATELQDLYRRFRHINRSRTGTITKQELKLIPELAMNPLCSRIISVLDSEDDDQINFRQFSRTLSALNPGAPTSVKLNLSFKCLDVDNDGIYIIHFF